jgi:hypothetical protein
MSKQACLVTLTLLSVFIIHNVSYAVNWTRSGNVTEKEWSKGKPKVFGVLGSPPPNNNNCSDNDESLTFNISELAKLAGDQFDVNKIYVDGFGSGGDYALDRWLDDWNDHGQGYSLPALIVGNNWSGVDTISICVGGWVQLETLDSQLESIIFWYDGAVSTTQQPYPKNRPAGDPMDLSNEADSLTTSENGNTISIFNGSGMKKHETDPPNNGKPDFIVNKVWLTTVGGAEQYTYNITDEIKMNAELKNIGDDDIPGSEYVHTRFYLSRGYKEDSHSEWVRVGTDETLGSNLDPGETHSEQEGLKLWNQDIVQPGKVYNVVVCTDRISDQSNGSGDWSEKHESNNCSTEAVFTVNGSFNFTVTSLGFSGGSTSFAPGETVSIESVAYNAGSNAPRDTRVGYFFSGGNIQGDMIIGTDAIKEENFTAGTSKTEVLSGITVPEEPGLYLLKACTDYDNRVQETNENDNCQTVNFTVENVPPSAPPTRHINPGVLQLLLD